MKQQQTIYEKIEKSLYKRDSDCTDLSPRELQAKKRMMLCVSKLMNDPMTPDTDLITGLQNGFDGAVEAVSQSQAYRDITMVNKLVGNIQLSAKNWYRHIIIEGAKKAYSLAIDEKDTRGAAACLNVIGKYTRADKDDDAPNWDEMLPPSLEPSDDITLLDGMKPIDSAELEKKRIEFRELFKKEAESTQFKELKKDE